MGSNRSFDFQYNLEGKRVSFVSIVKNHLGLFVNVKMNFLIFTRIFKHYTIQVHYAFTSSPNFVFCILKFSIFGF